MRKRYNTPHRSRVVKTRMTEEEYAEFAERLSACNMSQAEFIRQAITGAAIRPTITVSPVNDELLACRCREADRRIRQDRRQLKPDSPDAERVAQPLPAACRGGTGGGFRPCCPKV